MAFDDMYGQFQALNRVIFFTIFSCLNDFIPQKVSFSRLMRVYVGLVMLQAYTQSRFPCFLLVCRVWDISSGIDPCFPLLDDCANVQTPEENNQYSANYSQCNINSKPIHNTQLQCCGSGMFILIFVYPGSWIPDPRSRIPDPGSKNSNKREG